MCLVQHQVTNQIEHGSVCSSSFLSPQESTKIRGKSLHKLLGFQMLYIVSRSLFKQMVFFFFFSFGNYEKWPSYCKKKKYRSKLFELVTLFSPWRYFPYNRVSDNIWETLLVLYDSEWAFFILLTVINRQDLVVCKFWLFICR